MSVTLRWRMPWGAPVDERRADLCELRDHIEAVEERLVRHRDHIDSEINALNARLDLLCTKISMVYETVTALNHGMRQVLGCSPIVPLPALSSPRLDALEQRLGAIGATEEE